MNSQDFGWFPFSIYSKRIFLHFCQVCIPTYQIMKWFGHFPAKFERAKGILTNRKVLKILQQIRLLQFLPTTFLRVRRSWDTRPPLLRGQGSSHLPTIVGSVSYLSNLRRRGCCCIFVLLVIFRFFLDTSNSRLGNISSILSMFRHRT